MKHIGEVIGNVLIKIGEDLAAETKLYYLQASFSGQQFWDTYKHPDCQLLLTQTENPFK
jgi:hypothetical protein